jgi:hypothetical protein
MITAASPAEMAPNLTGFGNVLSALFFPSARPTSPHCLPVYLGISLGYWTFPLLLCRCGSHLRLTSRIGVFHPRCPLVAQDCRSGSRHPGTSDAEQRSDRACYRQPGTSLRKLYLSPPTSSHVGARHHQGHRQRQEPAATHCEEVDATDTADTGRLGRTVGNYLASNSNGMLALWRTCALGRRPSSATLVCRFTHRNK